MARHSEAEKTMITRNTTGANLSAGFITKLQTAVESPQIVFRYQVDSTTDLNENLDDNETLITVDDSSVFSDDDIITIGAEWMLVVDAAAGGNIIEVTRGYALSVATIHSTGIDIYILAEYDVMNVSDLSVDQNLGRPEAVVTVSNADQSWNIFLSDLTNHGNLGIIELKFSGLSENMSLFRGVVDHVELSDRDMTASIYLYDRLAKFLDQEMDPRPGALDLVNGPYTNPMSFIWEILVTEGGLDSTASQANRDIDYAKWDALKTKLAAQNFNIGVRIPRMHTYRSAIQAILYLCSCWGFMTHEGKIGFDYAANDAGAGDDTWTQAHILMNQNGRDIDGNAPYTDITEIVNDQWVSHGFDHTTGIWLSDTDGTIVHNSDGTSQGVYGIMASAEANPIVWHDTIASATGGSDWVEDIHKDPMIFAPLTTWLYGARVEIGDVIDLTDGDWSWTNKLMKVERVLSWNVTDFAIQVLLRA